MRKLRLILVGASALAAFFALSGIASARHDPACDQYGNVFGIYDFTVDTPDSHVAHAISGTTASWLACGSDISNGGGGVDSLFERFDITIGNGAQLNNTANMAQGSYAGSANIDFLTFAGSFANFWPDLPYILRVDNSQGTDCPVGAVVCLRGDADVGFLKYHNWNWATESGGQITLTIGLFHNDTTGQPAGLTRIHPFTLCANVGTPGSGQCGNASQPWLGKNGDGSYLPRPTCSNGNGVYTITGTNYAGQTTPPATTCVKWFPVAKRHL